MLHFSYIHFARMAEEARALLFKRVQGFYYNRKTRTGYLDFDSEKLYFDLTHPYISFFVLKEVNLPIVHRERDIGIFGFKLARIKTLEKDRVLYMLFEKKDTLKVVALELLGKSSYFLLIDEKGIIRAKYPAHRERKKGGDVGQTYTIPSSFANFDLKKYFPKIEKLDEKDLLKSFMESSTFYSDGEHVLPFKLTGYDCCGGFSDCMFNIYKKIRFNIESAFYLGENIPYYVYYKAAALLKRGLIDIDDNALMVDGYTIHVKKQGNRNDVAEHLYFIGKRLKRLQSLSDTEVQKDKLTQKLVSPSGYIVLVGKSAKDNNRITFNIARGDDTFFHVRDYRGAHVILKNHGMPITEQDILFCARLAKYHSKGRGGAVDIVYTPVKFVRPVPNSPGKVLLLKEHVVRV